MSENKTHSSRHAGSAEFPLRTNKPKTCHSQSAACFRSPPATKILCAFYAIFMLQASVYAAEITVGSTQLTIPAPMGFSQITSEMQPYYGITKRFVASDNEVLAVFLPNDLVAIAKAGKIPEETRKLDVQVPKEIIKPITTNAVFAKFKNVIKTQNDKFLREAESKMPGIIKKVTDGLAKDYDMHMNITSVQMIPMPVHSETDRSMAYSALVQINLDDGTGRIQPATSVVTATIVHVKGKVLLLYVRAEKSALEWSRSMAKAWSDQIIAQNPSNAVVATQATKPRADFNWEAISIKAILWGIIGGTAGLIGLIEVLFKK